MKKKSFAEKDVFAQIGYSDYVPQNYRYNNFMDREEFSVEMGKADIVITHGGTGAIIGAVKKERKSLLFHVLQNMENTLMTTSFSWLNSLMI